MSISGDMDFCDECGSTDIGNSTIDEWESKYELKYNKSFIYGKDNGRDKKRSETGGTTENEL